jgi:hypothetical protein
MRITATFLDEISSDIPHQNWVQEDWDRDFQSMKNMGIDTVIMIRCGLERFITYPSEILVNELGCYKPPVDLVDMFLTLAEKYGMRFFFGTYAACRNGHWKGLDLAKNWDFERRLLDEIYSRYGHRKAFQGWYLSKEIGDNSHPEVLDEFIRYSTYCKKLSGDLPTLISPGMIGRKCYAANDPNIRDLDFSKHEEDWDYIMKRLSGYVNIIAFQDGHVSFYELADALKLNKKLADRHGIELWSNVESFDRDMPFRFPPIKWEKMLLKLNAAKEARITNGITFEFSHFMSPNSFWPQAGNLYKRYMDYLSQETEDV